MTGAGLGDITGNGTAVTGLGGARGYGETELPRGDDTVAQVNVAAVFESGFSLGGVQYAADELFIATDGLISFGSAVSGVAATAGSIAAPFFAIFNGDVDTRLDGEGAESGGVWLDVDTARDCVTITWDQVGFYRRNASLTDTFQIQLFDRGNSGFEVVYRYQNISWTAGDLQGGWGGLDGIAALIGHRATASGSAVLLGASGNQTAELALAQDLGNTGVAGLWVWGFLAPALIIGTASADRLNGTTDSDTMLGLGGNDVLMGSEGADVMDGGSGTDRADYGMATAAVLIDLADLARNLGFAAGDSYLRIEIYAGSNFADTLLGGGGAVHFLGNDGADSLEGRLGDDRMFGGAGRDTLRGGNGHDTLDGGTEGDLIFGNLGNDQLLGGLGNDSLLGGNGFDRLYGGDGNDQISGGSGFGTMFGGGGDDLLTGGHGRDLVYGGSGADVLRAGGGDDTLDGGLGVDTLTGGSGADEFRHAGTGGQGSDWITDFSNAEGDHLVFGIAGAVKADFSVTFVAVAGAGSAGVAEAYVTYLPLDRLIWLLVDGAGEAAILLHSSMNSFDLL